MAMLSERQVGAALRRGSVFIVGLAVVTGAAAAVTSAALPARFVASQALAVEPPLLSASGAALGEAGQTRLLSTNSKLLVSNSVLEEAGESVGTAVESLRDRLNVQTDTNSDLVHVSITAGDPKRAAAELRAVIVTAQETEIATERARIQSALDGVDREIEASRTDPSSRAGVDLAALEPARANLTAALASLASSMHLVGTPTTEETSNGPSLPVATGTGVVVGGVLGAALTLFRTRYRARILGVEDVRALGLTVLAGPEDWVDQAARRISNIAYDDSGRRRPLVLVHVGGEIPDLDDAMLRLAGHEAQRLRLVEVRPAGHASPSLRSDDHPEISMVSLDEDAVFAPAYKRALEGATEGWVLVSVAASDQAVLRASSIVGRAVVAVREGHESEELDRLGRALAGSRVELLGVLLIGKRSANRVRAPQGGDGAAETIGAATGSV